MFLFLILVFVHRNFSMGVITYIRENTIQRLTFIAENPNFKIKR